MFEGPTSVYVALCMKGSAAYFKIVVAGIKPTVFVPFPGYRSEVRKVDLLVTFFVQTSTVQYY
jgi:hypothetical protein